MVRLENIKPHDFIVNFPLENGHVRTYEFKAPHGNRRSIREIPEDVYTYLRFETDTFQDGFLILVEDAETDAQIKEEYEEVKPEYLYTVEEIKDCLSHANKLKKAITEDTPKEVIWDFVKIAREIGVDSEAVKKYLAKLLGQENNREVIFPEND